MYFIITKGVVKFDIFIFPKMTQIYFLFFSQLSPPYQQVTTQDPLAVFVSCATVSLHHSLRLVPSTSPSSITSSSLRLSLVSVLLSALHQSACTVVVFLTRAHRRLAYISSLSATNHLILGLKLLLTTAKK